MSNEDEPSMRTPTPREIIGYFRNAFDQTHGTQITKLLGFGLVKRVPPLFRKVDIEPCFTAQYCVLLAPCEYANPADRFWDIESRSRLVEKVRQFLPSSSPSILPGRYSGTSVLVVDDAEAQSRFVVNLNSDSQEVENEFWAEAVGRILKGDTESGPDPSVLFPLQTIRDESWIIATLPSEEPYGSALHRDLIFDPEALERKLVRFQTFVENMTQAMHEVKG